MRQVTISCDGPGCNRSQNVEEGKAQTNWLQFWVDANRIIVMALNGDVDKEIMARFHQTYRVFCGKHCAILEFSNQIDKLIS